MRKRSRPETTESDAESSRASSTSSSSSRGSHSNSISSEDAAEKLKVAKKQQRRKEIAALLSEQALLASSEEMRSLRNFVTSVMDSNEVGNGKSSRRSTVVSATNLPDMFGLYRNSRADGSGKPASGRAQPPHLRDGGTASSVKASQGSLLLSASFHQTRWRLAMVDGADPQFRWVPSTQSPHDAVAVAAASHHSSRAGIDLEQFKMRRQEQDEASDESLLKSVTVQQAAWRHHLDEVTFADNSEFLRLVDYLRTCEGDRECQERAQKLFALLSALGYSRTCALLGLFWACRSLHVAHDRFVCRMRDQDAEHQEAQALDFDDAAEVVLFCCYWIARERHEHFRSLVARSLTRAEGPALDVNGLKSLLDLVERHPMVVAGRGSASAKQPQEAGNASDDGLRSILRFFCAERTRRDLLRQQTVAEALVNVPLQRQQEKYNDFLSAFGSLQSKIATAEIELGLDYLEEELDVQLEISRRLEECVHAGALLQEQLAGKVCSFLMESALWTLPPTVALQHREIEEALEKFLWNHPFAIRNDDLCTTQLVGDLRRMLLVNLTLRRAANRKQSLVSAMRKLESELQRAVEAEVDEGIALPKV